MARAKRFDIAGYAGIAFPLAPVDRLVVVAKFISIWLLWDDVDVESGANRWRLNEAQLADESAPSGFSRFDRGWWALFREFRARRSPEWVRGLCQAMRSWDASAAEEAAMFARFAEGGGLPVFDRQSRLRAATIGMAPTIFLLEDLFDQELPRAFHASPATERLKELAGVLVGLGNEVFSFAKDLSEGQPNLASNLILNEGFSPTDAMARLIALHDDGVAEFDRIAREFDSSEPLVRRWVRELRFAILGFTIWESQAPRYANHKVVAGGCVIEPSL